MDAAKLGRFIAETRKARGMTRPAGGAALCHDKTVSKWERGRGFPDIRPWSLWPRRWRSPWWI